MARSFAGRLEEEADAKGLEGERRRRWIGGAWNRIRGARQRGAWRSSRESAILARYFGTIHDVRQEKRPGGGVAFRQGRKWYHMPRREYDELVRSAVLSDKEEARARKTIAGHREREAKTREAQQRELERFERAQYRDVVAIIKRAGGIRPFKAGPGERRRYFKGEYESLPSTVRSARGRLDLDEAAQAVADEMPWLGIATPDDLVGFFDRHATRRKRRA